MSISRVVPCVLVMAFFVSGCAGFVAGDLRDTKSDYRIPVCKKVQAEYQVIYKSDAKDDGGDQNISGIVSWLTLGIVPTYWTSTVHSEATILHDGAPTYTRNYKSRIHKFYGILWLFILSSKSTNALQADEGAGLRIEWGIRDRTLCKVVADHGGSKDQYCLLNEDYP